MACSTASIAALRGGCNPNAAKYSMTDLYISVDELSKNEIQDVDYSIESSIRGAKVLVLAPHGGWIEPGTSEIARAIAGGDLSLYIFKGLVPGRPHRDLHVASERFDEPTAMRMLNQTELAIGIHGMKNNDAGQDVWVGGRDIALRDVVAMTLAKEGFASVTRLAGQALAGWARSNVCNRGSRKAGIQLEISRRLRDQLVENADLLNRFASIIRSEIV